MRRVGVLWSGDHLFDGVRETLELLRRKGEKHDIFPYVVLI